MIHNCGKVYTLMQIEAMQPEAISFLHLLTIAAVVKLKTKYGQKQL